MEEKEIEAWKKDMWMADIETDGENTTPMWVGWNSSFPRDNETQKM